MASLFSRGAGSDWPDQENDPVSPEMRRLWIESDRLIAEQDRARRRAGVGGALRSIAIGICLGAIALGLLAGRY